MTLAGTAVNPVFTEAIMNIDRVTLRRVHLDRQGYDEFGHYWGSGQKLYWASYKYWEDHFRAFNRADARDFIQTKFGKDVKFYR